MKIIIIALLFLPFTALAQVQDDFSDANFTANPAWHGDSSQFQISTYSNSSWSSAPRLQLDGTAADTSCLYIATPISTLDNQQWDFWLRLTLNTSKSNNCRVYLVSDSPNLKGNLKGYYVMFGDDINDQLDSISLWKQDGMTTQKLIAGHHCFTGASSSYRIKVQRDNSGAWSLFSDQTGSTNYVLEGTCIDNTFNNSSYFGIFCKYTSTNKTNFYFDDIYVGPIIVDTTRPAVLSVNVVSSTQLDITFSEHVEQTTAEAISNYNVSGFGNPISATKDAVLGNIVHSLYSSSFLNGNTYSISIANVQDYSENVMVAVSIPFTFYEAHEFDIVINEIMADPDPPMGLPNQEYIELFNKTTSPINIKDWSLDINSSHVSLPNITIASNAYCIICDEDGVGLFIPYGTAIGIPSLSLTNTGATIVLQNAAGSLIHFVTYSDSWYRNSIKADGGWSLEQIDANNPCGEMANWKVSIDPSGGTPGKLNSVRGNNPDVSIPKLIRASASRYEPLRAKIFFNEPLDSIFMDNLAKYTVDNGIGNPSTIVFSKPDNMSATLFFSQELLPHIVYTLSISDSIFDCSGNKILANSTARFALPEMPDSADLVINEVLSNPKEDGVDFAEIYNRSEKILDFMDVNLASPEDSRVITNDNFLIFPKEYIVLTTNPDKVKEQYSTPNPYSFIKMESFPTFNNDDGTVILSTTADTVIDAMTYTADMHFPLLNSTDGVSLERIDYNRPASDETNWHSAAESVGFATPAYENSQYFPGNFKDDMAVSVEPEIFSPDNDGYNDVLNINCTADGPGKIISIAIYDAKGCLVRNLMKSKLISKKETFSWDGTQDDATKANIGIYVIYVESFDLKGSVKHYKRTAVLATKF